MHDINPLGTIMHLKELNRQAGPKTRAVHRPVRIMRAALTAVMFGFCGAATLAWLGNL